MNSSWKQLENRAVCDKVLLLNKCFNNMFVLYKGKLPDIFLFRHPTGTILGNGLCLAAGAQIIDEEPIGDRVAIGVDAVVYKRASESDKMVIRNSFGEIKDNKRLYQQIYFRTEIPRSA